MTEVEKQKGTLSAIFQRKGRDGSYTRLFSNLELEQQEFLARVASLQEIELPVVGSVEAKDRWLVITTARVVWESQGQIHSIPINSLRSVAPEPGGWTGGAKTKRSPCSLNVRTVNDEQQTITVEGGPPLFGVWNLLLNLCVRNRRTHTKEVTAPSELKDKKG